MTTSTFQNSQFRLASRPVGLPTLANWSFTTEQVPEIKEGEFLIKVKTISLDPAMRGWMNDVKSYIPPVQIGEVMRAGGVGEVVLSNHPQFKVGEIVQGGFGVQTFSIQSDKSYKRNGVSKIDLSLGNECTWLNVLGMPGMTAYFGLKEVGLPQAGETIVVSAAAGAVGQVVGQLAKIYGLRVIGIAGGREKCKWVVDELGFDGCIDYKASSTAVKEGLKEYCGKGVDIYFDNVGGEILDQVLAKINRKARIVICGAISQYNAEKEIGVIGPKNYLSLLVNRARMEGMVVFDYADRYDLGVKEMGGYLKEGKMKSKEHVIEGIQHFPSALNLLFSGGNFGKLVLKVN